MMCVIMVHGMEGTGDVCPTTQNLAVSPVPTFACCALGPCRVTGRIPQLATFRPFRGASFIYRYVHNYGFGICLWSTVLDVPRTVAFVPVLYIAQTKIASAANSTRAK